MRADFGAFFENADADFVALLVGELFSFDRRCKPGRAGAYDDDIVLHGFAF